MKTRLLLAALAAAAVLCPAPRAQATCVIAPDGKSIDVVTDNGADEEKNCAVTCQVDTKIGVVAKAHSLCDFDKPEAWYKKVISSQDTCKGAAASAAPVAPPPVAAAAPTVKPGTFICRISADGHSFDAMIANPYNVEAGCQVNCRLSTTLAGATEQSSCSKNVAPGVGAVVLCSHSFDKGKLVKVIGGSGSCQDPTPKPSAADKDDDDVDKLVNAPMPKPSAGNKESDEDMEKVMNDPAKMQEYIRKQMDPASQR